MLVLTRRLGETVMVNGDIGITVIGIKGDRVKLGFNAPRDVTVDRQEIHSRRLEFLAEGDLSCEEGAVSK